MYIFKLLKANDEDNQDLLASMHHLRWCVFYKKLKWSVGLQLHNCMEFDEYDTEGAYYIVRVNPDNKVDAACRLIPTTRPYMLADHYAHFIENEPVPNSDDIWEFTRICASPEAIKSSNGKITAQLIAAAMEFGLVHGIKNYISLTTDALYPMLKRSVGWDPVPLGEKQPTPDDIAYSLKYTVSKPMLDHIKARNKINAPLLFNFDSIQTSAQSFTQAPIRMAA